VKEIKTHPTVENLLAISEDLLKGMVHEMRANAITNLSPLSWPFGLDRKSPCLLRAICPGELLLMLTSRRCPT